MQSKLSGQVVRGNKGKNIDKDLVSPPSLRNRALIGLLLGTFLGILAIPGLRTLFNLVPPDPYAWAVIIGGSPSLRGEY